MLLAASPYFYFFIHGAEQKAAKHEMEERLEEGILQTIAIPVNEIKWAEKGKEAWLNDRLFDIKSMRLSGDQFILTGLYDDEETVLVEDLIRNQQKQNASENKLMAGFFQLFNYTGTDQSETSLILSESKNRFGELMICIISHQPAVHAPPPRLGC